MAQYKLVRAFCRWELWEKRENNKCYLRVIVEGNDPNARENCVDSLTATGEQEREDTIDVLIWFTLTAHLNKCWQAKAVHS